MHKHLALAVSAVLAASFAAVPALAAQTDAPRPSEPTGAHAKEIAGGLKNSWGLTFLPSGDMLVTERPGRVRYITPTGDVSMPLPGAPKVRAIGQGGMLDIAASPDFATTGHVFISYSERRSERASGTTVVRLKLSGTGNAARLKSPKIIFRQLPAQSSGNHYGSRLVFAPDGKLFITLGERNNRPSAQSLGTHLGKIVRINPDGSVPKDNPFVGRKDAKPEVWSYGHRNPQAAAINPVTGNLWVTEHGARGGDEINISRPGKNYGWPIISYGRHYSGRGFPSGTSKRGMEQPTYYWDPSIAPSGMMFYTGDKFPQWRGNLFAGALKYRQISRLILDGDKVVAEEVLVKGVKERVRAIRQSPTGDVYFITDASHGKLMRLMPGR